MPIIFIKETKDKIKAMFALSFLNSIHQLILYKDFFRVLFPYCQKQYIKKNKKKVQQTIEKLKQKDKIAVAFFIQTPSIWKYESLYKLLINNQKFYPILVVCPFNVNLKYSKKEYFKNMDETEIFLKQNNYNYITTYDKISNKWIDIKKTLNPDIIFFTKPYKDSLPQYYIYNFADKITCYTSYGFTCVNIYRLNYNLPLNNLLTHFFVETKFQKEFAEKYSLVKGDNVIVTGGLGVEDIISKTYISKDVWKHQNKYKKRIIWAPHHSLFDLFNFSCFLNYYEIMLEFADKYKNEIQIAFKPHPVLKSKLINLWGLEKTENYYNKWQYLKNGQLETGYYIDLFLSSDAMIHDSASFTAEYLHTKKPVLFTVRDIDNVKKQWNLFGIIAFNSHYHAHNEQDIESFIQNVVLDGNDPMAEQRKIFFDEYLYPKDGIMPSEKILNVLLKDIDNNDYQRVLELTKGW